MIHYHGTPCGGPRQDVARFLAGRHCLIPFPRPEDLAIAADVCQSFCLDNGAFSAWKSGEALDIPAYAAWVEQWHRHPGFDWCLIPDVIDGTEAENERLIRDWKTTLPGHLIPSVPVWHLHESLDYLRWLAGCNKMLALGSSGQWATPGTTGWWDRMGEAMSVLCDEHGRPMCKLHGLRMLSPEICARLPLHSADSTNAVRNASNSSRFGSYLPPTHSQRMTVIADRMEQSQSAPCWRKEPTRELWQLETI